jgi:hypothetical protein
MAQKTATFKVTREDNGYTGYVCIDDATGKACARTRYTAPDTSQENLHDVPNSVMDEAESKGYIVIDSRFKAW